MSGQSSQPGTASQHMGDGGFYSFPNGTGAGGVKTACLIIITDRVRHLAKWPRLRDFLIAD